MNFSRETCMQVKKQQLELDMEQDWFQIGKGVCQGWMQSPCFFNLYAEVHHMKYWAGRLKSWNQDC